MDIMMRNNRYALNAIKNALLAMEVNKINV